MQEQKQGLGGHIAWMGGGEGRGEGEGEKEGEEDEEEGEEA